MGEQFDALPMATKMKVDKAVSYDLDLAAKKLSCDTGARSRQQRPTPAYIDACRESWSSKDGLSKLDKYLEHMAASQKAR